MLRSVRLIADDLKTKIEKGHDTAIKKNDRTIFYETEGISGIEIDIKPGDIMTGWEIIASLPLEEQKVIETHVNVYEAGRGASPVDIYVKIKDAKISLYSFYKWNGEKWEEE